MESVYFGRKPAWAMGLLAILLLCPWMSWAAEPEPAEPGRSSRRATLIPFPFVFYSDETRFGGGVSLSYVTRRAGAAEDERPANHGLLALYTERDQYSVGLSVDRYFREEAWHLVVEASFLEFPGDFFGFGNGTDADSSEVYTPRGVMLGWALERRVVGRWQTGPTAMWYQRDLVRLAEGGRLERDRPTGARDGSMLQLGWSTTWDGRSHTFYPRAGGWMRWTSAFAAPALAGDFSYTHHALDLRHYRSFGEGTRGRPVLALRALLMHSAGSVPFDQMPTLGGANLLRGFFGGRFRDRSLGAVQAEIRVGHWRRFGAVAFLETGTVGPGVERLRAAELHASYGIGLRWQLSRAEQIHIRADLGFDDEGGSGFYLAFLEAF